MKTEEPSKFCAGHAIAGQDVESIHPASEIATTGTPGALTANPAGHEWGAFETWACFGLMVAVFGFVVIEDRVRG